MEIAGLVDDGLDMHLDAVLAVLEKPDAAPLSVMVQVSEKAGDALEAMLFQGLLRRRDSRDGTLYYSAPMETGRPFLNTVKARLKMIKAGLRHTTEDMFGLIGASPDILKDYPGLSAEEARYAAAVLLTELQNYHDNPPKGGWKVEPRIYIDPAYEGPELEGFFHRVLYLLLGLVLYLGFWGVAGVIIVAISVGIGTAIGVGAMVSLSELWDMLIN